MKQQLEIKITEDGHVYVKTIGMDDERCLDYVPLLENMLDAKTIKSEFTEEYLQAQQQVTEDIYVQNKNVIKEERKR